MVQHLTGQIKLIRLLSTPNRLPNSITNALQIELYADGKPLVNYNKFNIYLRGLLLSLKTAGKHLIICCSCGCAFCDAVGEHITEVIHHPGSIEWKGKGAVPPIHYYFDKDRYIQVVQQLSTELDQFFNQYKAKIHNELLQDEQMGGITCCPDNLLYDWLRNQK